MKKLIFILCVMLVGYAANAQTKAFSQTTFNPTGTVTNTGVDTMTVILSHSYSNVAIQPVITKTSGTVAGTSVLYSSVNGTNWVATGDTLTNTNTTTNTTVWNKVSAANYWRIITTGSGTMVATTAAKVSAN